MTDTVAQPITLTDERLRRLRLYTEENIRRGSAQASVPILDSTDTLALVLEVQRTRGEVAS